MPRPTAAAAGDVAVRASHASPERVRRRASTGPSAIRWCGAALVISTVTTSPGRMVSTGSIIEDTSGVKCTSRLSGPRPESRCVAASLRPSPSATSSSTRRPTRAEFSAQAISLTSVTSRS